MHAIHQLIRTVKCLASELSSAPQVITCHSKTISLYFLNKPSRIIILILFLQEDVCEPTLSRRSSAISATTPQISPSSPLAAPKTIQPSSQCTISSTFTKYAFHAFFRCTCNHLCVKLPTRSISHSFDPFQQFDDHGVGKLLEMAVSSARKANKSLTQCVISESHGCDFRCKQ
jgi:hypothetical protein